MQAISQQLMLLEQIAARLRAITARNDPGRKKDLVVARRDLMDQLLKMEQVVKGDQPLGDGSDTMGEFGRRLAYLRTSTARFQAEWPAVTIDDDPARYAEGAQASGQRLRDFIEWGHHAFR
jgi:hypothetical protein